MNLPCLDAVLRINDFGIPCLETSSFSAVLQTRHFLYQDEVYRVTREVPWMGYGTYDWLEAQTESGNSLRIRMLVTADWGFHF